MLDIVAQRFGFSLPAVFIACSQRSRSVPKPAKQNGCQVGTIVLSETRGLSLFLVIRDGLGSVLYTLRHTFLTRLGQSGCDAWTLARIAGHSSIAICSRYVHPSEDAVLDAVSWLGGHKIGHSFAAVSKSGASHPCKVCPSQLSHFKGAVHKMVCLSCPLRRMRQAP